jgi:GNAT superfamily N-acetyltransferase
VGAVAQVHPKEPLWYLAVLVADPSAQRSGIGTRLLGAVLERADEEGVRCYLETQNRDNIPY